MRFQPVKEMFSVQLGGEFRLFLLPGARAHPFRRPARRLALGCRLSCASRARTAAAASAEDGGISAQVAQPAAYAQAAAAAPAKRVTAADAAAAAEAAGAAEVTESSPLLELIRRPIC